MRNRPWVWFVAAFAVAALLVLTTEALMLAPPTMSRARVGQVNQPGAWWIPNAAQTLARSGYDYIKLARTTAFPTAADCVGCPTLADLGKATVLPGGLGLVQLSPNPPTQQGTTVGCRPEEQLVVLRTGSYCARWVLWGGLVGSLTVQGVVNGAWAPGPAGTAAEVDPPSSRCDAQQWYQSPNRAWGVLTVWRWLDGLSGPDLAARVAEGWQAETNDWSPDCISGAPDGAHGQGRYLVRSSVFGQPPASAKAR